MGRLIQFPGAGKNGALQIANTYAERDYPRLAEAWTEMQAQLTHLSTPRLDGQGYAWAGHMMMATRPGGEEELAMVAVRGILAPEGRNVAADAISHLMQAGMGREQPRQIGNPQATLLQRVHDNTTGYWFEIESLEDGGERDLHVTRPEASLSLTVVERQISVSGLAEAMDYFGTRAESSVETLEDIAAMLATVPALQD